MNEQEFQQRLGELISQIDQMPDGQRQAMHELAEQTKTRHEKLRKSVRDLQESLDYLRLSVKYLVFDLEATRRENQYLRKMLQQATDGQPDQPEGGPPPDRQS